jgi:hypothetical protein
MFSFDHYERTRPDAANIRGAIDWSISDGRPDIVGTMVARASGWSSDAELRSLSPFIEFALSAEDRLDPDDLVVVLLRAATGLGVRIGGRAYPYADRAVAVASSASDALRGFALAFRGYTGSITAAFARNEDLKARSYADLDQAAQLASTVDARLRALILGYRGMADLNFNAIDDARASFEAATRIAGPAAADLSNAPVWTLYVGLLAHLQGDDDVALAQLKRGRALLEHWTDDTGSPGAASPIALAVTVIDGPTRAWEVMRSIRDRLEVGAFFFDKADVLLGCAIIAANEADLRHASTLMACMRAHTLAVGQPTRTSIAYVLYLHYRDLIRSKLPDEEARAARELGESMTLDEGLAYAFRGGHA